jgi:hypothetical protein
MSIRKNRMVRHVYHELDGKIERGYLCVSLRMSKKPICDHQSLGRIKFCMPTRYRTDSIPSRDFDEGQRLCASTVLWARTFALVQMQDTFVHIPVQIQHEASTRRLICPRGNMQLRIYVKVTAEFRHNADTISAVMEFRTDEFPQRLAVPRVVPSEDEGIAIHSAWMDGTPNVGEPILGPFHVHGPVDLLQVILSDRAVGGSPPREVTFAPWEEGMNSSQF